MTYFVAIVFVLFIISIFSFDGENTFSKEKMPLLRVIMAFVIILAHLCPRVNVSWIQPFKFWGAPLVSLFFFISGYGLTSSRQLYGKEFFLNRVMKIIVPFLMTVGFYYILVRIPENDYFIDIVSVVKRGTSRQHHLWYVFAILILYFAHHLCWKLTSDVSKLSSLYAISIVVVLLFWILGYGRCWYVSLLAFPTGATYSLLNGEVKKLCFRNRLTYIASFVFVVALAGVFYLTKVELLYSVSHIFIALAVALIVTQISYESISCKTVLFLGTISYEIYLCQLIPMDFLRGPVCFVGSDTLYIALCFVMTTIIAVILHVLYKTISRSCHA